MDTKEMRFMLIHLFPFVRFASLVVKPSMTSPQQATTKVTKGYIRNALLCFFPFVRFAFLVVKPVCRRHRRCNHEGEHKGHKGTQRKCASFL